MFGLKNLRKPEGANVAYYFLEIERAKASYQDRESSLLRKVHTFLAYRRARAAT